MVTKTQTQKNNSKKVYGSNKKIILNNKHMNKINLKLKFKREVKV